MMTTCKVKQVRLLSKNILFFIITESELNVEVKSGVRTIAHQGRKFLGWGRGGGALLSRERK